MIKLQYGICIYCLLIFVFFKWKVVGGVVVSENIPDQHIKKMKEFELTIPRTTFVNDDNTTIHVRVSENDWISAIYLNPLVEAEFFNSGFESGHYSLFILDDYIYINTNFDTVFWIVDISQPSSPVYVSRTEFGEKKCGRVIVEGSFAYVSCNEEINILDVSSKISPRVIGTYENDKLKPRAELLVIGSELYVCLNYDYEPILIIDVSNKQHPVLKRKIFAKGNFKSFVGLAKYQDYLFTTKYGEDSVYNFCTIFNISKGQNASLVESSCVRLCPNNEIAGFSVGLIVKNSFSYVSCGGAGLSIFNISDPLNPVFISSTFFEVFHSASSMSDEEYVIDVLAVEIPDSDDDILITLQQVRLISNGKYGFVVINATNKTDPQMITNYTLIEKGFTIYQEIRYYDVLSIQNGFLYSIDRFNVLRVINLSDISHPYTLPEHDSTKGLSVGYVMSFISVFLSEDGYLYISDLDFSIKIFDVSSDRYRPKLVGEYIGDKEFYPGAVVASSNYSYVIGQHGLKILLTQFDKSNPTVIGQYGDQSILDNLWNMKIFLPLADSGEVDEFVYVSCDEGIFMLNVSVKTNPQLSSVITDTYTYDVFVRGDYVFAAHSKNVGIYNKITRELVATVDTLNPKSVFVREDDILFIADDTDGVKIFNVNSIKKPVMISSYDTEAANKVFVQGDIVFIVDLEKFGPADKITVIDVSDLEDPKLLFYVFGFIDLKDAVVKDNIIYAVDGSTGLKIVDLGIRLVGSDSFNHFCGETSVTVFAKDKTSEVKQTLKIFREDYCNGVGTCKEGLKCKCNEEYTGDRCETWKCFSIEFNEVERTCNGHGACTAPNNCYCSGGFGGKSCELNVLLYALLIPSLSIGGTFGIIFLVCLICLCFVCVCCLAISTSLMILTLCGGIVYRLRSSIRKYEQLEDFDYILQEQLLEKDNSVPHLRINKMLFEIEYDEIEVIRMIGEGGSSAKVFLAKWQGNIIAFKCFKTRRICSSQDYFDRFEDEVNLLISVNHPGIIRFFGCSLKPPRVGILMEFCENGELLEFFVQYREKNKKRYEMSEKIRMCREICSSVEYLHSRKIVHRDIKSENILVDGSKHCKLMDFGISRIILNQEKDFKKTKRIGTSCYMAPEILNGFYTDKVDSFSFGILLWVMFTEIEDPYENKYKMRGQSVEIFVANNPDVRPNLQKVKESFLEKKYHWIADVMKKCWDENPEFRYSFNELSEIFERETERIEEEKEKSKEFDMEK